MNTATTPHTATRRGTNLALATWVSAINFWAWNMIGPLSTTYAAKLELSSTKASMLVATPILVGSIGWVVAGALTDRFGGILRPYRLRHSLGNAGTPWDEVNYG